MVNVDTEARHQRLAIRVDHDLDIVTDRQYFTSAVSNLVQNAVKHRWRRPRHKPYHGTRACEGPTRQNSVSCHEGSRRRHETWPSSDATNTRLPGCSAA